MITYCITQPLQSYNDVVEGHTVGLFEYYGHGPVLALILLATRAPFEYEQLSRTTPGARPRKFLDEWEAALVGTVNARLSTRSMAEHLTTLSPEEMQHLLQTSADTEFLPLARLYGGVPQLLAVVEARVLHWKMFSKFQILGVHGNRIDVQFGSYTPNKEEQALLSVMRP